MTNTLQIHPHQLNKQQQSDLDALCAACKAVDGHTVATYPYLLSQLRPSSQTILCYEKNRLIGFLSPFFFYDNVCELALMVAPSARQRGLATQMLEHIMPILQAEEIQTITYSVPHLLLHSKLLACGFEYQGTEYAMQREQHSLCPPPSHQALTIRLATFADIPMMTLIDHTCFPDDASDMTSRFQELLRDPNYKLFLAEKEGNIIGKAHTHWRQDTVHLTDIAILPAFQQHGFGTELITHCINDALQANRNIISLDVETHHKNALTLYTRLGFSIHNACDFWSISIKKAVGILKKIPS